MISPLFWIVLAIYLLAFFVWCLCFIFDQKKLLMGALRMVLGGLVLHFLVLLWHLAQKDYPYLTGPFETYQTMSAFIVLVFIILSLAHRFLVTGIVLLPVALVFYILGLTHRVAYPTAFHLLQNPWAFVHLVSMFLAIAIFVVSFVTGILYLLEEHQIKNKRVGGFLDRFPPLEIMDLIHYRALYAGFIFFSVGIIVGGGWSKSVVGYYVTNNLKQLLSLGAWIFFAIFLNLRVSRGWIGRKGIILASVGLIAVFFLLSWVQGG